MSNIQKGDKWGGSTMRSQTVLMAMLAGGVSIGSVDAQAAENACPVGNPIR
jgi:hypothetical protein